MEVAAGDGYVGGGLPARAFSISLGIDGQMRAWDGNQERFLGIGSTYGVKERNYVSRLVMCISERVIALADARRGDRSDQPVPADRMPSPDQLRNAS